MGLLAAALVKVWGACCCQGTPGLNGYADSSFKLLVELDVEDISDLALDDVSLEEVSVLLVFAVFFYHVFPYNE